MTKLEKPIAVMVKPSGDVIDDTVHIIEKALSAWGPIAKLQVLEIVATRLSIAEDVRNGF